MSKTSKTGELPKLEIGQGRRNVIAPPPAAPATLESASAPEPVKATFQPKAAVVKSAKKLASEVVNSLVFAPKAPKGRPISIYWQEATLTKLDEAAAKSGVSRSEFLEVLLNQVL